MTNDESVDRAPRRVISSAHTDPLLAALKVAAYPNCTLYLIWHYLNSGQYEEALVEYRGEYSKLGRHTTLVSRVFRDLAVQA